MCQEASGSSTKENSQKGPSSSNMAATCPDPSAVTVNFFFREFDNFWKKI